MTPEAPALLARAVRDIASSEPIITFPKTGDTSSADWWRFMAVRGVHMFEVGNVCGTCEFWFTRLPVEAPRLDIDALQDTLTRGLESLDGPAPAAFGSLLQSGSYRVALLSVVPEPVQPGAPDDYFVNEQRASWASLKYDGTHDPATSYYRVAGRSGVPLGKGSDLVFEFVAPLQREARLDPERIAFFEKLLAEGGRPTAVAASVFDVKQYYDSSISHGCLTHYLLDGHHKMAAAARTGRPIGLLCFITPTSLAWPDDIDLLLDNYGRPEAELVWREAR